jgi:hypothetical protein
MVTVPGTEEGLAQLEERLGLKLEPPYLLANDPEQHALEVDAFRTVGWPYLREQVIGGLIAWTTIMTPDQRERTDRKLFGALQSVLNQRGELPMASDTARLRLRDIINRLMFEHEMHGAHAIDENFRYSPRARTTLQELIVQFYEAVRDGKTFRVCERCGTPYEYVSERSRFCSDSCKTLAWRARKQPARPGRATK